MYGSLRDPKASPAMRRVAYSEYVKALEQGTAFDRAQEIAETVRFVLEPEFESEPFEVRPTIDGKGLLALGSPAQHAAIAEVIVELQRETRMIDIKASIVQVKAAELEDLTGGRTARTITGAELEALRKQLVPTATATPAELRDGLCETLLAREPRRRRGARGTRPRGRRGCAPRWCARRSGRTGPRDPRRPGGGSRPPPLRPDDVTR